MDVKCSDCGAVADPLEVCRCGGLPEFALGDLRLDPVGLRRVVRERRASYEPLFASGVWRWRELLPPIASDAIVSLAEGNVPLYDSAAGARYAGVDRLAYLHLGMNPTGSFKDLGMTVAISAAKASGARAVVCASTGNTASSMAAYASRAGLDAYAIVPRGRVSDAKLAQMREYGAQLIEVDGSFDDAFASLQRVSDAAVVNSINAYRIEGQKCAALAILEARAWAVPDWIALPGGNLGNISAIAKGLREALALGLIDRLPRLALDPRSTRRAHDGECDRGRQAAIATARIARTRAIQRHRTRRRRRCHPRRQGAHRARRHRVRTRLGRIARRPTGAACIGRHRTRRRCRRHTYRPRAERCSQSLRGSLRSHLRVTNMPLRDRFLVSVPATSANLGPGFDCVGIALDLRARAMVEPAHRFSLEFSGPQQPTHIGFERMLLDAMHTVSSELPRVRVHIFNEIPLGKGLGSSAAASALGITIAARAHGIELSRDDLAQRVCDLEGHPDNALPAVYGGMVIAASAHDHVKLAAPRDLHAIVVVPQLRSRNRTRTRAAAGAVRQSRRRLQLQRAALLGAALASGNWSVLREAMRDRVHQPHRAAVIPGLAEALAVDAPELLGIALSGAGPSVLALVQGRVAWRPIAARIAACFERAGIASRSYRLPFASRGLISRRYLTERKAA